LALTLLIANKTLRDAIVAKSGTDLLDATAQEVVDAVILWWRDGDGDLVDELVDRTHLFN